VQGLLCKHSGVSSWAAERWGLRKNRERSEGSGGSCGFQLYSGCLVPCCSTRRLDRVQAKCVQGCASCSRAGTTHVCLKLCSSSLLLPYMTRMCHGSSRRSLSATAAQFWTAHQVMLVWHVWSGNAGNKDTLPLHQQGCSAKLCQACNVPNCV
jgi:hypothetical protein